MWIGSRVIFYRHWSFYRAYLLRNNTHRIQQKKRVTEWEKTRKLSRKELRLFNTVFFSPSLSCFCIRWIWRMEQTTDNWLRCFFFYYLHTFPRSTNPKAVKSTPFQYYLYNSFDALNFDALFWPFFFYFQIESGKYIDWAILTHTNTRPAAGGL